MPKNYTFPYLFDESKSLSITDLKKMRYFKKNKTIGGTINWKRGSENTGSIGVKVTMSENDNYIDLNYTCNKQDYNYRVFVVSVKSNLNKGEILYFKCKFTGMRCRKLYLINGRFQHRTAIKKAMYSTQTKSKKWREIERVFGSYFDKDKFYAELYSKHFRKSYNGKPTKKYLKLMQKIKKVNSVDPNDIERLLLSK
ncbi:hypothetical protein [Polaribacter sp. IC063]|uniref:hypothetical protein n=1 Tax=Polaribacter sp. IC063 TaxID=57031 RepID=UPI0011BE8E94|nr:hypothetical protein [Polaribacter sp. IC063]TXD48134.1 hypothetical protein ES043_17985 [Polaribacter sp. IC063]